MIRPLVIEIIAFATESQIVQCLSYSKKEKIVILTARLKTSTC